MLAFRDISTRRRVEEHKHRFVSSVSHELRTPLSSIRGALELLVDGDAGTLPAEAHELAVTAERGSQRLSRLIDDIIDVERLASGDFDVVLAPVALDRVLAAAARSLECLAARHEVVIEVVPLGATVRCDASRLEQAVVNLLGNAVKFSPGGATVSLCSDVVGDGSEVVVSVVDHGRGIPDGEADHVFERFYQVRATDATEKGGTGLGLSITRAIVERHGGRVWVEPTPGGGATFRFAVPALAGREAHRVAG